MKTHKVTLQAIHKLGFTLIELVIYIGLVTIVVTIVANLNFSLGDQFTRQTHSAQAERDLTLIMNRLKQEIHAARDIDAIQSVFNTHPGKLQLIMNDASINPTIIEVVSTASGNELAITQGAEPQQYLTGEHSDVDNLIFRNLSVLSKSTLNVQVALRLSYETQNDFNTIVKYQSATTSYELMDNL